MHATLLPEKSPTRQRPKAYFVIVAHAPLASALKDACLHVFEDAQSCVFSLDVQASDSQESGLEKLEQLFASDALRAAEKGGAPMVLLSDVFGASPSNIATRYLESLPKARLNSSRMLVGVNLPMLFRLLSYRHEEIASLVQKGLAGAIQSIMSVGNSPRQNQSHQFHPRRGDHAATNYHHQQ